MLTASDIGPLCVVKNVIIKVLGGTHECREQESEYGEAVHGEIGFPRVDAVEVCHQQHKHLATAIHVLGETAMAGENMCSANKAGQPSHRLK